MVNQKELYDKISSQDDEINKLKQQLAEQEKENMEAKKKISEQEHEIRTCNVELKQFRERIHKLYEEKEKCMNYLDYILTDVRGYVFANKLRNLGFI